MIGRLLYTLKRNFTINKIVIFIFLFIYCGCYYEQYLPFISLSYLLLSGAFVYNLMKHKRVIHLQFVFISSVFVVYSVFSSLWANNFDTSFNESESSSYAQILVGPKYKP